jgi:hypothetical protein
MNLTISKNLALFVLALFRTKQNAFFHVITITIHTILFLTCLHRHRGGPGGGRANQEGGDCNRELHGQEVL